MTMVKVTNCCGMEEAERVKAELERACAGEYMKTRFLACPAGGSFDIMAETSYDLSTDYDGNPQDPEKAFLDRLVFLFAGALTRR